MTVAVVSWNTRELLADCLRSFEPEQRAGRAEVWVVDNGSDDGSPELVEREFGWASLVASDRNLGFGAAVNRVAAETAGPWLAIANADVGLRPGALEALLAAGEAQPEAGALAPRLLLKGGATQHSVYAFPTLPFTLAVNLGLGRISRRLGDRLCLEGYWDPQRARRVDWAIGALLLLRREAFDAAGRFDERQWLYAEDLDLGWRLAAAGWETRYVPEAEVLHASGAAAQQAFGTDRRERFMASTYAWMARRRGLPRTRAVAALNCAGAAVRFALAAALAPLFRRFAGPREEARAWWRAHRQGLRSREAILSHE